MGRNYSHRYRTSWSANAIGYKKEAQKQGTDLSESTATTSRSGVGQRALDLQKIDVGGARRRCVQ